MLGEASLITEYYPDISLDSVRGMDDIHPSKNPFRNQLIWYSSDKMLALNFTTTPDSGWFPAFKADCFATFGKLLLSNNLPLGYLAFSNKRHSQLNKGTTRQCRLWIFRKEGPRSTQTCRSRRRKPCAMPPQWCHKSPVDVKQETTTWQHPIEVQAYLSQVGFILNVSQTTNISTPWLMIQVM